MSSESARPPNATAASLLGFLHERPLSGWDLSRIAQEAIGEFWSITQSQVYRELATLARNGHVTAGETGARDRRPYEITAAGRRAFAEWMTTEPDREQVRSALLLKLAFGEHIDPASLTETLTSARGGHQRTLTAYEEIESTVELDRFDRATLAFGLHYERAVLEWFDELPDILGTPAPDES